MLDVLNIRLVALDMVQVVGVDGLLDGNVGLVGERLVLKHWGDAKSAGMFGRLGITGEGNLLNASSSRVRPAVSGKKK